MAAIDMGPMIDMVFLLLIFTLVSARISSDTVVKLDAPSSNQTQSDDNAAVHIAVDKSGAIHLGTTLIARFAQASIAQALLRKKAQRVVIHPDNATSTKDLMYVMDMSREAGAQYVDLAATSE